MLTEYSKRNSNNNIYIRAKNNTSYKDKNIGEQIKNIKYLSFNKNINLLRIINKSNYLNYNNKITFSYEQPDLMNNIFIILIWGNIIFNYFIFLPPLGI